MVTGTGIPSRPISRKAIYVKLLYDEKVKRIRGTSAEEDHGPGTLVIYDGLSVVGRFRGDVERWWIEDD
jgi:hypothetical protein